MKYSLQLLIFSYCANIWSSLFSRLAHCVSHSHRPQCWHRRAALPIRSECLLHILTVTKHAHASPWPGAQRPNMKLRIFVAVIVYLFGFDLVEFSIFSPGWSSTLYVDQTSCRLTEIHLSASWGSGLKACDTTSSGAQHFVIRHCEIKLTEILFEITLKLDLQL